MEDAFERRRHVQHHFIGRISQDPSDPGYNNWANLGQSGYEIEIRLDGIVQDHCSALDVEEGWIERLKCYQGNPIIVDGDFVMEKIKGEVEVLLTKPST